jgi:hypothetical protein
MDGELTKADLEVLRLAFRGAAEGSPHSGRIQDLVRRGYLRLMPVLTGKGLDAVRGKG